MTDIYAQDAVFTHSPVCYCECETRGSTVPTAVSRRISSNTLWSLVEECIVKDPNETPQCEKYQTASLWRLNGGAYFYTFLSSRATMHQTHVFIDTFKVLYSSWALIIDECLRCWRLRYVRWRQIRWAFGIELAILRMRGFRYTQRTGTK